MRPYGSVKRDFSEDECIRLGWYKRYGKPNTKRFKFSSKTLKHRARQLSRRICKMES